MSPFRPVPYGSTPTRYVCPQCLDVEERDAHSAPFTLCGTCRLGLHYSKPKKKQRLPRIEVPGRKRPKRR